MDAKVKAAIITAALAGFTAGSVSSVALAEKKKEDKQSTSKKDTMKKTSDKEPKCGSEGCGGEDGEHE
ncbi:MAG: hypothetical protein COT74_07000 [Bdellovibrionales bacterium CG10_big_fil_rev_8_21_14_0_10_45_34]|nr:MAG: hypothetical protein COT74_07000 [Bdellovibrionales bacterium CG10_big_fil_rev_8_21_14_0_10_45_34]